MPSASRGIGKPMILVVQNWVPHYRKAFFNALCDLDEVTVVHSGVPSRNATDKYRELVVPSRRIGPFVFQKGLAAVIRELAPQCVIASADIRNITSVVAMFRFDRALRWIWWGMDRGASRMAYGVKKLIARRDNPLVFYNDYIRTEFERSGVPADRLFVANNTFHVESHGSLHEHAPKDILINVGTLDARKQNDVLIRAFARIVGIAKTELKLYIIGEGAQRNFLNELVRSHGLEGRVVLTGKIEDPEILRAYYSRAIASVSFGQAGLAVLQSMAFGVPFVTKATAISGGEKHNIIHGVNGFFCEDDEKALEVLLLQLVSDPGLAAKLGHNAYRHYIDKASIGNMVNGFRSAIAYQCKIEHGSYSG